MEKRKKLHDYSLLLIFLAVLDVFSFFATLIASVVDGAVNEALAKVEPSLLDGVKIGLVVVAVLMAVLTLSEAFIGLKGLRVSRKPSTNKGYITAAKVFLVLSIIASASFFVSFFEHNTSIVNDIFNFVNAVLDVVVYVIFIKAANDVRADALVVE